jgi:hypothetical protein
VLSIGGGACIKVGLQVLKTKHPSIIVPRLLHPTSSRVDNESFANRTNYVSQVNSTLTMISGFRGLYLAKWAELKQGGPKPFLSKFKLKFKPIWIQQKSDKKKKQEYTVGKLFTKSKIWSLQKNRTYFRLVRPSSNGDKYLLKFILI